MTRPPRILFVHAGGRRERLARLEQGGALAEEFFYGLPQLRRLGFDVDLLETSDLEPSPHALRFRWAAYKDRRRYRRLGMAHCERLFVGTRFDEYDVIIAGTEYVALGLLDHLRRTPNKPKLLFFVMGMLSKPLVGFQEGSRARDRALHRYRRLLQRASYALFLGEGELQKALEHFPELKGRLCLLPFGVDTGFWTPGDAQSDGSLLFVGNDANRDVEMLVDLAAVMPERKFIALTARLKGRPVPPNLEVVVSGWKSEVLSDEEIRDYYRRAAAVILPIKDTWQPSGQSVALQAMACGRPVVISDFAGFWERGAFRDGEEIFYASPNSAASFAVILSTLLSQPELAARVGEQARQLIIQRYSLDSFGQRLARFVESAAAQENSSRRERAAAAQ
ncbi:MAG: glycosyltransferase family 4 protein [Oricola sp.]